ncbi:uncharacterized protein LOC116200393 [Punica granatum]|uniref:Uncharacterized protein LOC116200393 n=1 Tax=Punica granatum TaxID=22663 RepID=A0A6P8CYE2_PUNGR|nr:uncharacterized protein LOC116200393 [Punica granatum]
MGHGKLVLKFLTKDSLRRTTFEKRKKGLMKKLEEFSILCGVDPERVKQVIDQYFSEGVDRCKKHAKDLPSNGAVRAEDETGGMKKRHLAAKESAVMNTSGMVPMQMDDFKYDNSVHMHMDDYMPLDGIKPPLEFQQLAIPYLPPLMDPNMMINNSMMWSKVGDSSANTSNSNSILANHHNENNYYYNYSLTHRPGS